MIRVNQLLAIVMVILYSQVQPCFGQADAANNTKAAITQKAVCFSIMVMPPAKPPQAGDEVKVSITVTNIGGEDIYWSYAKTNTPYKAFHVSLNRDGHEVETTAYHRKMTGNQRADDPQEVEGGDSIALPFAAGKSFTWIIDLSKLYEIKQPGNYFLSVSRFDGCSGTEVQSNVLPINIR